MKPSKAEYRGVAHVLLGLVAGTAICSYELMKPAPTEAQQVTLPTPDSSIVLQTSAPGRCANVGDWYTTNGASNITPGETLSTTVPPLCGPNDPSPVGNTTTPGNFIHRFLINISPALATTGTTVRVLGAGSGGARDEVDGQSIGTPGTPDPTRFALISPSGAVLGTQTFNGPGDAAFTIPAGSPPGSYIVTSETGEQLINPSAPFNPLLNNDDNGFLIQVDGDASLVVGQFQGTFQNARVPLNTDFSLYFLVGPDTGAVDLLNFDFDFDPNNNNVTLDYIAPTGGAAVRGTPSRGGEWNDRSGTPQKPTSLAAPDSFDVAIANSGRWEIRISGYGNGFTNQSILEVRERLRQIPLPIIEIPPTTAGNITVVDTGRRVNGRCVVRVTNNFFTTDIVNLQGDVLAADGTTALPNTDAAIGDTLPDTGVLRPTEFREVTILGTVNAFSFMQRKVSGASTPIPITCGPTATTGTSNLILVKRITNVTRNGAVLPGVNFSSVIDDPSSANDNDPGWSQIPLTGVLAVPETNPVQSGDEVTYTVYYLANGSAPALDTNICDLIPTGTTYVLGSLQRRQANDQPASVGDYFTPLAPLPANNSCPIQTNPNGAAIVPLGTVSNGAGSNFGFIQFRVRVD